MSTHNIGFYEDLTKIIFELSSNIIKYVPDFFCCYWFHFNNLLKHIFQNIVLHKNSHLYLRTLKTHHLD